MAVTQTANKPTKKNLLDSALIYNKAELFSGVALSFNGTTNKVDIGDISASIKTAILCIKPGTTSESIIDLDGGTSTIGLSSGLVVGLNWTTPTYYIDGYESTNALEADVWYMIALTSDTAITVDNLDFGLITSSYYDGLISNVIFYSKALTASQIEEVWRDPGRPIATGLIAADCVGWWPMCENNGELAVLDYSGNDNPGTITGATYTNGIGKPLLQTAARNSKYLNFNGSDTYTTLTGTSALTFDNNISFACWIRPRTLNSYQRIIAGTWQPAVYTINNANNSITGGVKTSTSTYAGVSATNSLTADALHHVIMSYDGSNIRLFVNGVLSGTPVAVAGTLDTPTADWRVASNAGGTPAFYFDGIIYDAGIWNKGLTEVEALSLYNSGVPVLPTSNTGNYVSADKLVHYSINNGERSWTDLTANEYNGTVTGTGGEYFEVQGLTAGKSYTGFELSNKKTLSFSGSEYASAPTNTALELTTDITLAAWVNIDAIGSQMTVIAKNLSFELAIGSGGAVIMSVYQTTNKTLITTTTLSANTWYYIVGTYESGTMNVYIDGLLDDTSTSYTGVFDSTTAAIEVGRNNGSTYWTGKIDEPKTYGEVKTAQEVQLNYRTGLPDHP